MTVHVHIERLVLDGLAVDDLAGPRLQEAVAAELTRLVGAAPAAAVPAEHRTVPRGRPDRVIDLADRPDPDRLGARIADVLAPTVVTGPAPEGAST